MIHTGFNNEINGLILHNKINSKMYLIENKEVTLLYKLNR